MGTNSRAGEGQRAGDGGDLLSGVRTPGWDVAAFAAGTGRRRRGRTRERGRPTGGGRREPLAFLGVRTPGYMMSRRVRGWDEGGGDGDENSRAGKANGRGTEGNLAYASGLLAGLPPGPGEGSRPSLSTSVPMLESAGIDPFLTHFDPFQKPRRRSGGVPHVFVK